MRKEGENALLSIMSIITHFLYLDEGTYMNITAIYFNINKYNFSTSEKLLNEKETFFFAYQLLQRLHLLTC